jgi:hypothetical protein
VWRFARLHTHTIPAFLAAVVLLTFSTTCLADDDMNTKERSCCAGMERECGSAMAQEHHCCRTSRGHLEPQMAATPRLALAVPGSTPIPTVEYASAIDRTTRAWTFAHASDASPPRSGSSTYLILSVFRI